MQKQEEMGSSLSSVLKETLVQMSYHSDGFRTVMAPQYSWIKGQRQYLEPE
jgi:hypothetical protein